MEQKIAEMQDSVRKAKVNVTDHCYVTSQCLQVIGDSSLNIKLKSQQKYFVRTI